VVEPIWYGLFKEKKKGMGGEEEGSNARILNTQ
jgi:hypothetical protein